MGTAARSAPLRRAGSLLGLLGLELGAVLALHWLGRFPGLRIGWDGPVPWVLSSPVQDVLGAVLRTVGLVMAYWLLASTVLYLLASLTRLPSAVRAVRWATLPLARRVADHAVAVTLATSMVGGGTLGMAGPALAADSRGPGPPARAPVAAAQQPTDTTAYGFEEAGPGAADQTTSSTGETTTTTSASSTSTTASPTRATSASSTTTTTSEPSTTATTQAPTTQAPRSTEPPTTPTTQPPTTTTRPPTTTGRPATTTTTTTTPGAARAAPPAYKFEDAGRGAAAPATTAGPASTAAPTSTAGLREPAYPFITPEEDREAREASGDAGSGGGGGDQGSGSSGGGGSGGGGSGGGAGGEEREEADQQEPYVVQRGDNLWTIARDHLRGARSGGSGEPTNREVAEYWAKVVEANRHGLESCDPDLIYPDEEISLPPAD